MFVGLRCWEQKDFEKDNPNSLIKGRYNKNGRIIHINTDYIKYVDESNSVLVLDNGKEYRLDEESMNVFVTAIYGNEK